jgi:hypothetical protein
MSHDDSTGDKHPSFGMVQFSRTQCGGLHLRNRLFGSPLPYHLSTIRLRITEGERLNDGTGDRFMGWKTVVEVELSPQQYADLLTEMNVGSGVPCTIRYIGGKAIADPPDDSKTEIDHVRDKFTQEVRKTAAEFKGAVKEAKALLAQKKPMTVQEKQQLAGALDKLVQTVDRDFSFWLDCFVEASTKVAGVVKAEAESFVVTAIHKAGLDAVKTQVLDGIRGLLPGAKE